ncbi:RelE/StbE family addiction module toxin [Bacteroidia bacterium]|nr:RelE/StbE family addiction module toxin [Bacteroidia bacterium]GHT61113.1 RelE/StbE family addiction module toxin [Bacteroidia bacterium]GHV31506.1 RelE/StbE family addiction module toxin [Bacteroidia bacterium]
MDGDKPKRKTPKDFFNSFSEESENELYLVDYTNKFKKSVNLCYKRDLDLSLLETVIKILSKKGILPSIYSPHPLKGYKKKANEMVMECHIQSDWLLVWLQNDNELTLLLTDTGTHSDLFGA